MAESATLQANIRPFAVREPRYVIRRTNMYVISTQFIVELARHSIGLTDLLRLQTLALQHIIEISVAPDIELHRSLQLHAAFAQDPCQPSMHNFCPYLPFYVLTHPP